MEAISSAFEAITNRSKLKIGERVRPEVSKLIERGGVTSEEVRSLRLNSWEWDALTLALDDEAFAHRVEYVLANCGRAKRPPTTYEDAVIGLLAEMLKRFRSATRDARAYAETIDGVRQALGQDATHYMIVASDVKELVHAIEICESYGGCRATTVLRQLRDNTR